jgi:hypothetical protein
VLSAQLNLSTDVDKFCSPQSFFSSKNFLKPLRWLNTANFRLAVNGKVFTDWWIAVHFSQRSVFKNALVFR